MRQDRFNFGSVLVLGMVRETTCRFSLFSFLGERTTDRMMIIDQKFGVGCWRKMTKVLIFFVLGEVPGDLRILQPSSPGLRKSHADLALRDDKVRAAGNL